MFYLVYDYSQHIRTYGGDYMSYNPSIMDITIKDLQGNLYHINKIWVNGNDDMVVEIKKEGEQYE